jgi:hypothetical protein
MVGSSVAKRKIRHKINIQAYTTTPHHNLNKNTNNQVFAKGSLIHKVAARSCQNFRVSNIKIIELEIVLYLEYSFWQTTNTHIFFKKKRVVHTQGSKLQRQALTIFKQKVKYI